MYTHLHIHTYIHACMHTYIHTYIHTGAPPAAARRPAGGEREEFGGWQTGLDTPSPPIKSLVFRGLDSSRLLILRGGNSHVR